MKVLGKGRPWHICQRRVALFSGLEMTGINGAVQFFQRFSGGSLGELGEGRLSAVCSEHLIDPLWDSVL